MNRCSSVERVVLTSSVAAVVGDQAERGKGYVYTEDDWNTTCTDLNLTYHQAKKLSEKTAHEMHEAQSRCCLHLLSCFVLECDFYNARIQGYLCNKKHHCT